MPCVEAVISGIPDAYVSAGYTRVAWEMKNKTMCTFPGLTETD